MVEVVVEKDVWSVVLLWGHKMNKGTIHGSNTFGKNISKINSWLFLTLPEQLMNLVLLKVLPAQVCIQPFLHAVQQIQHPTSCQLLLADVQ